MDTQIKSLDQLITKLKTASKAEYKSLGVSLQISPQELKAYMHWSKKQYTRNCILREGDFELILLCWEPGQGTPIHCHGGEECWVYVIDGKIEEKHYHYDDQRLVLQDSSRLTSGGKSFMNDNFGYHKLQNCGDSRALSLHLYMDPIDTCTVFNSDLNEFVPVELTYHSYKGVLEKVNA